MRREAQLTVGDAAPGHVVLSDVKDKADESVSSILHDSASVLASRVLP